MRNIIKIVRGKAKYFYAIQVSFIPNTMATHAINYLLIAYRHLLLENQGHVSASSKTTAQLWLITVHMRT